jgi:quercetin dioxygenase-like cupin family protein
MIECKLHKQSANGKIGEKARMNKSTRIRRPLRIEHPLIGMTQYEIVNTAEYCGKIIVQRRGTRTPSHRHKRKHETFLLWAGKVRMIIDGVNYEMEPGDVVSVERDTVHEFTAVESDSVLLEFSTCSSPRDSYFADDTIWRQVNHRENESTNYAWPFCPSKS